MTPTVKRFEELRPRLMRVAYSHLGSIAEAEDVVQEAWLRLQRADEATIDDLGAWLTTVVSRLALDALGSARARRERYVGPWLPDPLVEAPASDADSADRVTLDESVSLALLFVLGEIGGLWRPAKKGKKLLITVEPFGRLTQSIKDELAAQAEHLAPVRGATTADVRFEAV